jgi:adenylyltransferase/sulfurtransferase
MRHIENWRSSGIQQSAFLVAGVGALGNEVAKNLALLGAGRIALVDFDTVSMSNLSRSVLFRAADVGLPKTDVAARALQDINPELRVLSWSADVTREIGVGVFRRMDLVFGCVDSVSARYHLNRSCWRAGVPWVEGGIAAHIGTVKAFRPPDSPCYECTMSLEDRKALRPKRLSCSDPPALASRLSTPTTPLIASITGAWMVQQGLAIMAGEDKGGLSWHINSASGESFPARYDRRLDCLTHDERFDRQDIIELPARAGSVSLGEFLDLASARLGSPTQLELGRSVVTSLTCPKCRQAEAVWLDRDDLVDQKRICPVCGYLRTPAYTQSIGRDPGLLDRSLADLSIPPLEIVVSTGNGRYGLFELTNDEETLLHWM